MGNLYFWLLVLTFGMLIARMLWLVGLIFAGKSFEVPIEDDDDVAWRVVIGDAVRREANEDKDEWERLAA